MGNKFKKKYKIVGIMQYKKDAYDRIERERKAEYVKIKYPEPEIEEKEEVEEIRADNEENTVVTTTPKLETTTTSIEL